MTVALYARVSTEEQAQQGFSIEDQKQRLIAFCASQGWEDYQLFIDDGNTGKNMDRPELKRMLWHIDQGNISSVVVYKLDRLSRRQKDVLYLLEDIFEKRNVSFRSVTEPFDTSTPFGKAMIGILAVFAQLERDVIIERTSSGRRQRILSGKWYGGRIPFGYDWDKDNQELVVVPIYAEIVKKIYAYFLSGKSLNWISDWLKMQTHTFSSIDHARVKDILRRPIYTGRMNLNGQLVKGTHEPIIDIETWELTQKEFEQRKAGVTPTGKYLLSGLLECGVCGGGIVHVKYRGSNHAYEYYACKTQHQRKKDRKIDNCSLGYHRRDQIEQLVIEKIRKLAINPKTMNTELKKLQKPNIDEERLLTSLNQSLKEVDQKLEQWFNLFERKKINPAQLESRMLVLNEEKRKIELHIDEVNFARKPHQEILFINTLRSVETTWEELTFEEKQNVLRLLIEKIILQPKNMEPEFHWSL